MHEPPASYHSEGILGSSLKFRPRFMRSSGCAVTRSIGPIDQTFRKRQGLRKPHIDAGKNQKDKKTRKLQSPT